MPLSGRRSVSERQCDTRPSSMTPGKVKEHAVTDLQAEATATIPCGHFRPAPKQAQDTARDRYAAHMSGSWKASLVDEHTDHVMDSTVWNLGEMVVTLNDFPARRVTRTSLLARADNLDHYYVHLPLADAGMRVATDNLDDETHVPAGMPVMMDLSRPFDTLQGGGRSMQAFMPRETLDELLPSPRDIHATPMQGAAASILADLLQSLTRRLPSMAKAEAADVAKSTMHLVAASLTPTSCTLERARPAIEASLLRQACRFIDLHLSEEDFAAERLSATFKISRATLYRLFEPYGGVAHYVRERRLVRAHAAICERNRRRPIARIAEEHGFKSAAQFSRAFREHFGYPPSHAAGLVAGITNTASATDLTEGESLADWLRPLRG
jgi:AraC-like DNA-binding protein